MSLGCSATNCASSCRRTCAGAEERSAWSSVGSLSVGLHERAILADRTPPTMIQLRLGRPTAKRNLRTKVSKPQKPTILDWSHQPHHRRLPRQRFSAMTRYGTGGGQVGITAPDPRAEIMARVWPNTFIEESNLKVQVPGL